MGKIIRHPIFRLAPLSKFLLDPPWNSIPPTAGGASDDVECSLEVQVTELPFGPWVPRGWCSGHVQLGMETRTQPSSQAGEIRSRRNKTNTGCNKPPHWSGPSPARPVPTYFERQVPFHTCVNDNTRIRGSRLVSRGAKGSSYCKGSTKL